MKPILTIALTLLASVSMGQTDTLSRQLQITQCPKNCDMVWVRGYVVPTKDKDKPIYLDSLKRSFPKNVAVWRVKE